MNKQLLITSSNKQYAVDFVESGDHLLHELSLIENSLIVMDRNIEQLYPDLCAKLKSTSKLYSIDATEQNKTLLGAEAVLKFFQTAHATHSSTVIAIGGGILQDIVSFAAHVFYRGLNLILVPTTLLAMCDSCIGGKCGLNFQGYKNQIGAFHPPTRVINWPGFLASLPEVDIRSGYGEILKYTLLSQADSYEKLKRDLTQGFDHLPINYIYHGLLTKKKWIEEDEFDTGMRRLLNFGHTFGHALERALDHAIPHGIAVAHGIDIANYISWQYGFLHEKIVKDVHSTITKFFSYNVGIELSADMLIANVAKDKKVLNGKLNMVLMEDIGKFRIEPVQMDEKLKVVMVNYLQCFSSFNVYLRFGLYT